VKYEKGGKSHHDDEALDKKTVTAIIVDQEVNEGGSCMED
jgi:hypothetical protein